jgi:hypothetical protein
MTLLTDTQYMDLYARLDRLVRRSGCTHTLRRTRASLQALNVDVRDIRANIAKLIDLGGHCDCEVLLNVSPRVWQEQREEELQTPSIIGEAESDAFVSHAMFEAIQLTLWEHS